MSNGQMQTRGLSAADWTRLKRLNGAKNYKDVNLDTNKDINPPTHPQLPHGLPIHVYRVGGSSKIRRPASDWIAYRASQTADYPTPSGRVVPFVEPGTVQVMTRLCNCSNSVLDTKVAGCISCQYNPIETYTPAPPAEERPIGTGLTYAAYVFDETMASDKPSLQDNLSTWGTLDPSKLLLPGFNGLATTDFIPTFYNSAPGGMDDYDYVAIYMYGFFRAPVSGAYIFTTQSDDGLQLQFNAGTIILNLPGSSNSGSGTSDAITLVAGQYYPFDALWSNGTGAIRFEITDITVNGQSLFTDLGIPIKECFFLAPP